VNLTLYAIEARNLTKAFKELTAVKSVDFSVDEGEIFGLLGPNGAGKTTTIRMIITLTKPTSGSVSVFGVDALRKPDEVRRMLGYVPQLVSVDSGLTAYENLLIFSKLFQVERSIRKKRIEEALEYMNLSDRANDLVLHFSGGMMRRLEIAQALVNRPKILFLDEPSIGLDPTARKQGWDYIKSLNQEFGTTIFITTHDMLEADELCDRIAIMNHGKIVVMGFPGELKSLIGGDLVTVKVSPGDKRILLPPEIGSIVSNEEGLVKIQTGRAELVLSKIVEFLEHAGFAIDSVSVSKPTLDDVFTKYTQTTLHEEDTSMFKEARMVRQSFARHAG
jgi:ABC-2 type transport system ATP-binding protein